MNRIEPLLEQLHREHDLAQRVYYNADFSLHRIMQKYLDGIAGNIERGSTAVSAGFEELAEFYLMAGLYGVVFGEDKKKAHGLLSPAAASSYALLVLFNKHCAGSSDTLVIMRKAAYLWASLFLAKWEGEAQCVGDALIDSLNKKGSIIRYGSRLYPEAWFMVDLHCRVYDRSYDKGYADYPKDMTPYDEVLRTWDTTDLVEVDRLVSLLCEAHLLIEDDPDEPEFEYLHFGKAILKLYPYPVISFLAMRSVKGLENPAEFSHPLMCTPVVEMFLSLDSPLPKPDILPYGKTLVPKLKATCPQAELPAWLARA